MSLCKPQKNRSSYEKIADKLIIFVPWTIKVVNIVLSQVYYFINLKDFKFATWQFFWKYSRWENCRENDSGWPWKTWSTWEIIFSWLTITFPLLFGWISGRKFFSQAMASWICQSLPFIKAFIHGRLPWSKLWYSQEWKCHGKSEKFHWWVIISLWPGFGKVFKTAHMYQSDVNLWYKLAVLNNFPRPKNLELGRVRGKCRPNKEPSFLLYRERWRKVKKIGICTFLSSTNVLQMYLLEFAINRFQL